MGNCLVTKLKSIVDNENLEIFGVIRLKVPANFSVTNFKCPFGCSNSGGKFQFTDGITVVSSSTQTDYTSQGEAPCTKYIDTTHVVFERYDISSENGGWLIFNKYDNDFTYFDASGLYNPSPSAWIFMPNIKYAWYNRIDFADKIYDLSSFKSVTSLINFSISCNCTGNIQDLGFLTSLTNINFPNDTVLPSGSIEDFLNAQVTNGRTSGNLNMWTGKISYAGRTNNRNIQIGFDPSYENGWQEI